MSRSAIKNIRREEEGRNTWRHARPSNKENRAKKNPASAGTEQQRGNQGSEVIMEQERQQIKFQAVLNRAVLCDTCHLPLTRQRMLIIWNQDQAGVTGLKLVHKITCDDKRMKCSSGAAFGPNWSVAHERAIFAGKAFKHTEDENKLFSALRHVEMGDCHE